MLIYALVMTRIMELATGWMRSSGQTKFVGTVAFAALAMFVSYLPFSSVNGALGVLGTATRASDADVQWFTDAFALALAAVVLPAGALSERLGARALTLFGLVLTSVGCFLFILAGVVPAGGAVSVVLIAQAISGAGGGAVMSASLALISHVAPGAASRRRGIAVWAAAVTCGLGVGPFSSAAMLAIGGWTLLLLPVLALAAVTILVGICMSAEHRSEISRPVDFLGAGLSAVVVCSLVVAAIRAGSTGWGSIAPWVAVGLAAVCLCAFLFVERTSRSPILPLSLFATRSFTAAGVAAAATLFSIVGAVFTMSLLFAHDGKSAIDIALRLACFFAANALASVAAARLQTMIGSGRLLICGLVIAAAGAASVSLAGTDTAFANYAWRLALFGLGGGLVMATASAVAVAEVPSTLRAAAGAANNALRQIGAALGAAVLGSVLTAQSMAHSYIDAAQICTWILAGVLAAAALSCLLLQARRKPQAH